MCWKLALCPKYAFRIAFWNLSSSCNDEFRNLPFSRVTFGKSFWGCAARTDQKKSLFPTGRFQTWPLKSMPVFRPIKQGSQTRHKWAGINLFHHYFDQNALKKGFFKPFQIPHITLSFPCISEQRHYSVIWLLWQMLWYFTFFTSSSS